MKRIPLCILLLLICITTAYTFPKDQVTKKTIGDLTGDGKPEIAIETKSFGASSTSTKVVIKSKGKNILVIPNFNGDSADGYCVIGDRIAVWYGDWNLVETKWEPFYYDFTWYRYSKKSKKLEIIREGFTKKTYPADESQIKMPKLAKNSNSDLILSKRATFLEDAKSAIFRKFGVSVKKISELTWYKWDTNHGKKFIAEISRDPKGLALDASVTFRANGTIEVTKDTADL